MAAGLRPMRGPAGTTARPGVDGRATPRFRGRWAPPIGGRRTSAVPAVPAAFAARDRGRPRDRRCADRSTAVRPASAARMPVAAGGSPGPAFSGPRRRHGRSRERPAGRWPARGRHRPAGAVPGM